jgi:hypothetical protein
VTIDVEELTRMLAGRLAAIVPDGFYVEAANEMLWYSAEGGCFPGQSGNYQVGRSGTDVRVNSKAAARPPAMLGPQSLR